MHKFPQRTTIVEPMPIGRSILIYFLRSIPICIASKSERAHPAAEAAIDPVGGGP
jgi:hypothetical protein